MKKGKERNIMQRGKYYYLELVIAKLTLGGTAKPNDLATFARSRLSTSKIFLW
jgi:hypothetical protein